MTNTQRNTARDTIPLTPPAHAHSARAIDALFGEEQEVERLFRGIDDVSSLMRRDTENLLRATIPMPTKKVGAWDDIRNTTVAEQPLPGTFDPTSEKRLTRGFNVASDKDLPLV
jgi:hypothetical protein